MKITAQSEIKSFIAFLRAYENINDIDIASIDSGYVLKDFSKDTQDFYVYFLINPLNRKIFYVGKGKGNRALQHFKDYRRGKEKNCFKIKEIQTFAKKGYKPIVKIVADNLDEQLAYKIETKLIKRLYKGLTNISQNENEPNILKREVIKIFKNMPSYDDWIFGIALNKPIIYKILAKKNYGKDIYNLAANYIKALAKEYNYGK